MTNEIVKTEKDTQNLPVIMANNKLESAMLIATELSKSDIIPKEFQKKPANCLIAVELANRLKASPFQVMQNMDVIYGRPSLRSAFIIACINNSGKFIGTLKFEMDDKCTKCRAWAIEKETGARVIGPKITLDMAQAEGWLTKNGSKWKTMPDLMLRYRAATFFGRLYCPEILNGMYSEDEMHDMNTSAQAIDPFEHPIEPISEPQETKQIETSQEITEEMEAMANEYFEAHGE